MESRSPTQLKVKPAKLPQEKKVERAQPTTDNPMVDLSDRKAFFKTSEFFSKPRKFM